MPPGGANAALEATTVTRVQPGRSAAQLLERARRLGPLPYSESGRTPPPPAGDPAAVAEWMAEAIDRWWYDAGRPDPFTVVEVGAGDGTRAARVLGVGPECLGALRYILVEPDDLGADHALVHRRVLPIESPPLLFPPAPVDPGDPDEAPPPATGIGPLVTSLDDLPRLPGPGVILAVEWLSRLPANRVEWHEERWYEVRLAAEGNGLVEVLVPLERGTQAIVDGLVGRPSPGGRYAILVGATGWVGSALGGAAGGVLAVADRWTEKTEPCGPDQPPPLAVDQLARVRRPQDPVPGALPWGRSLVTWRLG
jgi:Putative S-adenosyl-L-methionine-dependent methyltransferase